MFNKEEAEKAIGITETMNGIALEGNKRKITQFLSLREHLIEAMKLINTQNSLINWIPFSEKVPPIFTQENGATFLAAWMDEDGEPEDIEWYNKQQDGFHCWMNQNSCNMNDLSKRPPTHWMLVTYTEV